MRLKKACVQVFFHATFSESNFRYIVIGAYTFENQAPFKIRSMSPYPIIFKDMFSGPLLTNKQYSMFPTGYVVETVDGVDLLHLSCGINELSIDIITFDKNNLIQSLTPITYSD